MYIKNALTSVGENMVDVCISFAIISNGLVGFSICDSPLFDFFSVDEI